MKYYLIAGEASGDLHASRLMQSLKKYDAEAEFRFFGGDLMAAAGGTMVRHYRELAYMGFVPVITHLPTILRNMRQCKRDIEQWSPDCVILVDYPGFNLDIAKHVHKNVGCQVFYYISPKIWAWKEYRIKRIKRDVDRLFSILPFEVDFYEHKHNYPISYVGNPTVSEVSEFLHPSPITQHPSPNTQHPIIALLAGSRKQEIKDNLPAMIEATSHLTGQYDVVVAGAPSIDESYYEPIIGNSDVRLVMNSTYDLLSRATAAIVTSGTATLETCLFGVPQVVCYKTPLPWLIGRLRRVVLSVEWVSLVNLIAQREVVTELVAETFSVANIRRELDSILPTGQARETMLDGYAEVRSRLGSQNAPDEAARQMVRLLKGERGTVFTSQRHPATHEEAR